MIGIGNDEELLAGVDEGVADDAVAVLEEQQAGNIGIGDDKELLAGVDQGVADDAVAILEEQQAGNIGEVLTRRDHDNDDEKKKRSTKSELVSDSRACLGSLARASYEAIGIDPSLALLADEVEFQALAGLEEEVPDDIRRA